jgi:SAM-dependent methyltransferase
VPDALTWRLALPDEVQWWDYWMETHGAQFPEGFITRQNPECPLQDEIRKHLDTQPGGPANILDVASGPMTWIGKRWDDRIIQITPVDVLAPLYDRLLAKHGIVPLVRTQYATIEELSKSVPRDSYDLVFCKNALDHCKNPMRGVFEMLKVVKPGRTVFLHHCRNEGKNENYTQLHQWNFDIDGTDGFIIESRLGRRWDVRAELAGLANVQSTCIEGPHEFGDILTAIKRTV